MSNGYLPRHNPDRADQLANGVVWHRRRWVRLVGVAVLVLGVAFGVFEAGHVVGHGHAHRTAEAEQHSHEPESQVVVEHAMPQVCVDALAVATQGFDVAAGHVSDMHDHIRDTGVATRDHLPDMADSVNKIEKLRGQLDDVAKACEEAGR